MSALSTRNPINVLAIIALLTFFSWGQPAPAQEESSTALENGVKKTEIVLLRRTSPEYGKSAYSFRYKTQSKAKHKNYVDIVYSANGYLRVSNHGDLTARVADLGETVGNGFDVSKVQDAAWQPLQIKPVAGHYYVQLINADKHDMKVVYRVDTVSDGKVELTAWFEKDKQEWPVSLERRGEAGTSGMNRSAPRTLR